MVSLKTNRNSENVHRVKKTINALKPVKLNIGQNITKNESSPLTHMLISALNQVQAQPTPEKRTAILVLWRWYEKGI